MTLTDFYNEVSRNTDTDTLKIGVSETKRVLAVMFMQLAKLDTVTAFDVIARGLENAKLKEDKA
jgi:hypothetical protein